VGDGGPSPRRAAAIAGIGQTQFAPALARSAWELALDAITAALADAGIDPGDVDGICRFAPPFEQVSEPMVVRALGIGELSFFAEAPLGGEALGAVIAHATAAIAAGQASVVVCYRALKQSSLGRYGRADSRSGPGPAGVTGAAGEIRVG
jgi:acetyl-CoA acetyltransferase